MRSDCGRNLRAFEQATEWRHNKAHGASRGKTEQSRNFHFKPPQPQRGDIKTKLGIEKIVTRSTPDLYFRACWNRGHAPKKFHPTFSFRH